MTLKEIQDRLMKISEMRGDLRVHILKKMNSTRILFGMFPDVIENFREWLV